MDNLYHQMKDILKIELRNIKSTNEYDDIVLNYKEIVKYFDKNIRNNIDGLTKQEFINFFQLVKTYRKGRIQIQPSLRDFENTKYYLKKLVDENISDEWKLENIVTSNKGIKGMQKTGPTILLHFYKPHKFSIWNTVIKSKLDEEGYFKELYYVRTSPTYTPWNEMQKKLAKDLKTNLWITEILWNRCKNEIYDGFGAKP